MCVWGGGGGDGICGNQKKSWLRMCSDSLSSCCSSSSRRFDSSVCRIVDLTRRFSVSCAAHFGNEMWKWNCCGNEKKKGSIHWQCAFLKMMVIRRRRWCVNYFFKNPLQQIIFSSHINLSLYLISFKKRSVFWTKRVYVWEKEIR